ncbi:sugar ABC transporter substrate-binding protein [Anaerocolumna sp. MB42-C2]|uniref:sugar ABC transporter substrate-binding protein n=1 Tax=Anaerocolumna sp. MB42-C2 TaxID=3070997 RepID=UPI0027E060FF|nr:substrate-binding domain-containing protein [Anaerocolumna sp. MB42-C2]WMJ88666.1 substrate-binding domain-containing protein [Anaerocolumna sp. MB42-C2]
MIRWIFGMLFGMLLLILVMFGQLLYNTNEDKGNQESVEKPEYHLQIIVQNTDEYFWSFFKEGAKAAEREYGVYVEFVPVSRKDAGVIKEAVEKGINAGVDGIAFQPADTKQTQDILAEAKKQGIGLLTYENDSFNIPNTPMVGSSSYNIGTMAGNMAVNATNGKSNVVVVMNEAGEQGDVLYRNLLIQGIMESFSKYGTINIRDIFTLNKDMFEAERVTSSIISDVKNVDLIICLDERSTPAVAQVLVDNNMVGDVKIIGYGFMPQTLDYIKRGVIYGTVCPNSYEIGYYTVKQLTQSLKGEQISDYTPTEVYSIDAKNVNQYNNVLK